MPIIPGVVASSKTGHLQPLAPTIGTATAGNAQATVTFTPAGTGPAATSFTATSTPGSFTATGSSSPLTVTGLTNGTSYSFTVHATNAAGNSPESAASNSVTPVQPIGNLGSWSYNNNYNRPNGLNYPAYTQTGTTLVGIGGNNAGGKTYSNYFDGSTWSGTFNLPVSSWRGSAAWDGTYSQMWGGFDSGTTAQSWSYYLTGATGNSFSTATNFPVTTSASPGLAISNQVVGFNWNSPFQIYYRSGTGSWSTGVNLGFSPTNMVAANNPSQTAGYLLTSTGSFYKMTSPSSAVSSISGMPVNQGAMSNLAVLTYGSTDAVWQTSGSNSTNASYRYTSNNNTWVSQTGITGNIYDAQNAIINSKWYVVAGDFDTLPNYYTTIS